MKKGQQNTNTSYVHIQTHTLQTHTHERTQIIGTYTTIACKNTNHNYRDTYNTNGLSKYFASIKLVNLTTVRALRSNLEGKFVLCSRYAIIIDNGRPCNGRKYTPKTYYWMNRNHVNHDLNTTTNLNLR